LAITILEPDYESLVGLDLLETLDLTYNNLQKLPPGLLCTLVNLKTVNVSHNSIEDLVDLGLSSFSIKDNKTTISSSSSSSCEISLELENLIVSNNGLKTATPGSFSALGGKIKKLILSRNQISVLVDDTFFGMENLEHIDISFNKLAALPPKIFKYTPKLTSIQLSNNTLGTISFNVFEGLEKLQALNLSGNNLDENWIRPGIFGGLHSLVVLDLSSNHLSRIESGLLSDTNALQYLNLGHNHIHTISASHAFASEAFASNIHTLVLSYNKLKALPDPQTLAGLSVLNTLGLDHNQLHSLHPSALRNCTVLEQISLNNNFLTEV
jgi:Leucine-rich repeat (LRR) protein